MVIWLEMAPPTHYMSLGWEWEDALHRAVAEKFGLDKEEPAELTPAQHRLKLIASGMCGKGATAGKQSERPERPKWARGAYVYLTKEHAAEIRDGEWGARLSAELKPWHMLVSEVYYNLVKEAAAMAKVQKLVVKGNLRHRIDKLGTEKDKALLSEDQKALRAIAKAQQNRLESLDGTKDGESQAPRPRDERPSWAAGAFVYCAKEHFAEVRHAMKEQGVILQSKHILVSEVHQDLLRRVLTMSPEGPGREAFLTRRAGAIEQVEAVNLPYVQLSRVHHPDVPHGNLIMEKCNRNTHFSEQLRGQKMGESMEQLAAAWKNIHDDLFDFLTAPPSVQSMYENAEDMWQEVWSLVCQENGDLEMLSRKGEETRPFEEEQPAGFQQQAATGVEDEDEDDKEPAGFYAYCKVCSQKANVSHLVSADCPVRNSGGPLLKAILAAEQNRLEAEEEDKVMRRQRQQEQQQQLQLQQQQQSVAMASHGYPDAECQLDVQTTSSLEYSQQLVGEQQHWYPPQYGHHGSGVYIHPAFLLSQQMFHWPVGVLTATEPWSRWSGQTPVEWPDPPP